MIFSNKFSKKPDAEKPVSDVKLIPVLTADQLLGNLRSQPWLNKIKNYLQLPEDHFEALYIRLIEEFSAFVQIFPVSTEGKLGSLLSESLARAILALKNAYESDPEKIATNHRYAYAIFSAALLLNAGYVTSTKITISDSKGRFIADWHPFQGNLIGKGEYYKIHRYAQIPPHLHRHAATILARQIMPELGFLWLSEDIRLFHMWLSLLNGDRANAGNLEFLLSITPEELENVWAEEPTLIPIEEFELTQPLDTQEAENFLHWLQAEIEKGNILINAPDANITVLHEGVFISMQLFKEFCNAFSSQHYTVLAKAFNHLGLTELSGGDFKFLQYFEKLASDKRHKINFKSEANKSVFGFLQKNTAAASTSEQAQKAEEQEGVLLKEKALLFSRDVETVQTARVSPAAPPEQLPRLDTTLGMEALARLT